MVNLMDRVAFTTSSPVFRDTLHHTENRPGGDHDPILVEALEQDRFAVPANTLKHVAVCLHHVAQTANIGVHVRAGADDFATCSWTKPRPPVHPSLSRLSVET